MVRKAILLGVLSTVTAFAFADCRSAELIVSITDARGRPVPDAVVIASTRGMTQPPKTPPAPAVMDQVNKAFAPSVLVVRTGTSVIFPNSDTVAHQVYSFSPAKRFELGLYRGHPHPPVTFDHPGLVVLGCNIHDNMVGYIFVTDSPYFGKSNDRGEWRMSALPAAEYDLTIWTPWLPRDADGVKQHVALGDAAPARVEFHLQQVLKPAAQTNSNARLRDY